MAVTNGKDVVVKVSPRSKRIKQSIAMSSDQTLEDNLRERYKALFRKTKVEYYKTIPEAWMSDILGVDGLSWEAHNPEVYKNHEWDGDREPFLKMCEYLSQGYDVNIRAATGVGKTYYAEKIAKWFLANHKDSLVVVTAPTLRQVKVNFWSEMTRSYKDFKKSYPNSEMRTLALKMNNFANDPDDEFAGWQCIGIVAGTSAQEKSATRFQGIHRENLLFIVDEVAGVSNAVMAAIINTCTGTNNLILTLSNPDSKVDQGAKFGRMDGVKNIRISALDFPNVVLDKEIIPGAASTKSIERRLKTYGPDSWFYLSRVRGITPDDSVNTLIRSEWIQAAKDNIKNIETDDSYNVMAIDVAQSEKGDEACIGSGMANIFMDLTSFQCTNATHLAYNVIYDDDTLDELGKTNFFTPKMSDFDIGTDGIVVDGNGLGIATVNAFHDEGYEEILSFQGGADMDRVPVGVTGKPQYTFRSIRQQALWELREDFRMGRIKLDIPQEQVDELIEQLTPLKFEVINGRIQITPKEDVIQQIGKSPNEADCLMMWNFARKDELGGEAFGTSGE